MEAIRTIFSQGDKIILKEHTYVYRCLHCYHIIYHRRMVPTTLTGIERNYKQRLIYVLLKNKGIDHLEILDIVHDVVDKYCGESRL